MSSGLSSKPLSTSTAVKKAVEGGSSVGEDASGVWRHRTGANGPIRREECLAKDSYAVRDLFVQLDLQPLVAAL